MRNRFDEQLESLNNSLIRMGALCESAIANATKALLEGDRTLAGRAIEADSEIDQAEREVESLCLKLLLQQQPVARDLRQISSALKMITDMERIGDQAADIAEIVRYMDEAADGETDSILGGEHLRGMSDFAAKMVTASIDAFVEKDLEKACKVINDDDVVDDYFEKVRADLIAAITDGAEKAQLYLDILMIAKYMERIADHATNIAEWVVYSITGRHPDMAAGEKGLE